MGRMVYITCVTLNVPRGGTTGKLLVTYYDSSGEEAAVPLVW